MDDMIEVIKKEIQQCLSHFIGEPINAQVIGRVQQRLLYALLSKVEYQSDCKHVSIEVAQGDDPHTLVFKAKNLFSFLLLHGVYVRPELLEGKDCYEGEWATFHFSNSQGGYITLKHPVKVFDIATPFPPYLPLEESGGES